MAEQMTIDCSGIVLGIWTGGPAGAGEISWCLIRGFSRYAPAPPGSRLFATLRAERRSAAFTPPRLRQLCRRNLGIGSAMLK